MSEMLFREGVHTYEARREQIRNITETTPDARIVGSVGRMAVLGCEPDIRTDWRGRLARDIDVTRVEGGELDIDVAGSEPFPLDHSFSDVFAVEPGADSVEVRYDSRHPEIAVELPSTLFEPYQAEVEGLEIPTLHPDTLRNIQRVYGTNRPKDRRNIAEFEKELGKVDYPKIDASAFEPLDELQAMVRSNKSTRRQQVVEHMQSVYIFNVPYPIRRLATPFMKRAKKLSGFEGRNHDTINVTERIG